MLKSKINRIIIGPVLFALILAIPAPESIGKDGWLVIAVAALMLSWWITEAIPIPVTATLPIILFPILGVMPIKEATAAYSNPLVFLFFGGFVIALAMKKWKLHLRIALSIVRLTGTHANGIIAGFMIATAFLSMWMSNTATTVMMLPIALSVLNLVLKRDDDNKSHKYFALSLMLSIAFAANIGGTATLTGTPPNAIFAGFMQERFNYNVDFATWMMVGFPFACVMLLLCWLIISFVAYPSKLGHIKGSREIINDKWEQLGPMSHGEKLVAIVFASTALLWIFKGVFDLPGLTDTGIAVSAALLMFLLPANIKQGEFLLKWEDTSKLPWGILLLFGGGLTLAAAMYQSGLVEVIGSYILPLSTYGIVTVVVVSIIVVLLMTECMSNMALISVFLPVLASIALELGENPLLFTIPSTLAASCAFMLPMATPPNAIVFASGHIHVSQMVRAGIIMNIISIILISLFAHSLINYVFGIEAGVLPKWAI